jgi:surface antigen
MSASKPIVGVAFALTLAACASSPDGALMGPRDNTGTVAGPAGGAPAAAAGAVASNRATGAAINTALGGLIGTRIGVAMDDEDKRRAYAAQMDALDRGPPGAPVAWKNPDSGRYGTIVPGPAYATTDGRNCRSFTHTIYIDGKPETARGTACHNADGSWTPVS